jgi:colanic acid biosynthesis glycosyl transferase WcaI
LIGFLKRAPFIYNVQELYPDAAVSLGALQQGFVLNALRRIERFVYARSFAVTAIAPGMYRTIVGRTGDTTKVHLIPNFVDTRVISARPRDNPFSREYGLNEVFTVMYAGNMGPAQGLETLLDAAGLTADDKGICYVFVGDGTSRADLQESARLRRLSNVQFIAQQPYDRVPDIYGAADLCVVPLVSGLATEAVPSKLYRIMAAERRILAIADPDSDLAEAVRESSSGFVVPPDNPQELATAILRAARTPDRAAETRGRDYATKHVERGRITKQYSDLLRVAADLHTRAGGRQQ